MVPCLITQTTGPAVAVVTNGALNKCASVVLGLSLDWGVAFGAGYYSDAATPLLKLSLGVSLA